MLGVPAKEAVSMRTCKLMAISVVSIALLLASVPAAFAAPHVRHHPAPYRVSKPSVPAEHVTMGLSFETTGVLVPAIAADDTSTTVAIEVYGRTSHGRSILVATVPAALSASADTGTVYDAIVTLPAAGPYGLVAAVSLSGSVVARSAARPVFAMLPYRVSTPRLASGRVVAGTSFDATGVVVPSIAADDASTTVSILVMRVGRRGRLTQVDSVAAALTGPVGDGTGYDASITLSSAGRYVLVAVVMQDGVVVGRSGQRPVRVSASAPVTPASARMRGM
jgi:hypothetical protein